MGFACHIKLEKAREYFTQNESSKNVIQFAACGDPINFHNLYAPQDGKPPIERIKYFDEVAANISSQKCHITNMYLGDFNAQMLGRRKNEQEVLGRYIFVRFIDYVEK